MCVCMHVHSPLGRTLCKVPRGLVHTYIHTFWFFPIDMGILHKTPRSFIPTYMHTYANLNFFLQAWVLHKAHIERGLCKAPTEMGLHHVLTERGVLQSPYGFLKPSQIHKVSIQRGLCKAPRAFAHTYT